MVVFPRYEAEGLSLSSISISIRLSILPTVPTCLSSPPLSNRSISDYYRRVLVSLRSAPLVTSMGALRRALFGVRQTLNVLRTTNPSAVITPLQSQTPFRSQLGAVSPFCSNSQSSSIDLSNEENKRQTINRMLYRSKQRGYLELDLVLGNWVEEHITSMDESRIKALVDVLDLENPDLWKWLTGQEQPPDSVNRNPVFSALREKVMGNLDTHVAPETRATPGNPWVRGWDDFKKGQDGPKFGNQ